MINVHKHKYCFWKQKGITQITAGLKFRGFPLSLVKHLKTLKTNGCKSKTFHAKNK